MAGFLSEKPPSTNPTPISSFPPSIAPALSALPQLSVYPPRSLPATKLVKDPPKSEIGGASGDPDYSKIVVGAMAKSWPLGAANLDVGSWKRDEVEPSGGGLRCPCGRYERCILEKERIRKLPLEVRSIDNSRVT